ncbi:MAG: histidine phosphatase family protein [Thermoguttaceae bacterium]|jgi:probable phosphoglycerate mutase
MNDPLPEIYLARHGETEWSKAGRHSGHTDLPLTAEGEEEARRLGQRLAGIKFEHVFTSPLERASRTCELVGFADQAEIVPDLIEWDYGQCEGRTGEEIRQQWPGWELFRDGCPGGESPAQITARVDRVVTRLRGFQEGRTLIFAHKHLLQILTARWIGLAIQEAPHFFLSTATLSILGYYRTVDDPVIRLWNSPCSSD